jgi:hypothetical protein
VQGTKWHLFYLTVNLTLTTLNQKLTMAEEQWALKLPQSPKVITQEYAKQWRPFKFSSLSEHARHLILISKGLIWGTVVWQLRHFGITLTPGAEKLTPPQFLLKFAKVELQFESWNVLAIPPNQCGVADFKAINQSVYLSSSFFGIKPDNTAGHKNVSQDIFLSRDPPPHTHTHKMRQLYYPFSKCISYHRLANAFVLRVLNKRNGNLESWVTAYYHKIYIKNKLCSHHIFIIRLNVAPFSVMLIYRSFKWSVEWLETACLESRIKKCSVSIITECKNLLTLGFS